MATLPELLEEACSEGFAAETSQVRLLQIIATLLNGDDMTVDEIMAAACESGISDVTSPVKLLVIIAQLMQSGAVSSDPQVFCGNYGAGLPTDVPTTACALAYSLDPPYALFHFENGVWA